MKYLFLTLISIFIYSFGKAQDKKYTDSAVAEYIEACKCVLKSHDGKATDFKRIRKTDFYNFAKKILYISFKNTDTSNHTPYFKNGLLNDEVIKEKHLLSSQETDSLNKTLFNYKYKGYPIKILVFECKTAENAIVYLDENNNAIAAINICFSQTGYSTWVNDRYKGTHGPSLYDTCFGKYELLAKLFRSAGIKNIK
ncbi:hypothetical protein [Pedobacter jeongneungensis]|uniref:hypothetical protein n=1 Tax=Pedobacter jeongneungensis TaxID=947309 RepID=UPI000469663F|nr:hypothetical protein [Pedobacter jeongneungensis]